MHYSKVISAIIAISMLLYVSVFGNQQLPDSDSTAQLRRDSLIRLEEQRNPLHQHPKLDSTVTYDPVSSNSSEIYRTDGTAPSEILRYKATSVSVPFALSNNMNRLLMYGNTAPITRFSSTGSLLVPSRFEGTDYFFSTQARKLHLGPGPQFTAKTQPDALVVPETVIFWENGVFNQNTLNLRFSRPLSRNLMFNAFSNYRHFQGQRFHHERNDVLKFYSTFASDTSVLMNRGYNPLINEHIVGGTLQWDQEDETSWTATFSYGDMSNEYALDLPTRSIDRLHWAKLNRYVYRGDASLSQSRIGPFDFDMRTGISDETYRYIYPALTIGQNASKEKAHKRGFYLSAESSLPLGTQSHLGFKHNLNLNKREFFDHSEKLILENTPELFYNRSFETGGVRGDLYGSAGALLLTRHNLTSITPTAALNADLEKQNHKLSLFLRQGAIPVYPSFDSRYFDAYTDDYRVLGTELFLDNELWGILFGYQFTQGISDLTVSNAWPEGKAPYKQPRHTFIIAPGTSRWKGLSFSAKAMLSDSRPYVKASGILSHVVHPAGTAEFIETQLALDYWSQRDPVSFADFRKWHDPIYDLNLKITAHIRSFRLFYKVDNLLNRRHAYVPGYFSPGVTFRWGINWFIQR